MIGPITHRCSYQDECCRDKCHCYNCHLFEMVPYICLWNDVNIQYVTDESGILQLTRRVGGWTVIAGNTTTPWFYLASGYLLDFQLSWKSKIEPSVAIITHTNLFRCSQSLQTFHSYPGLVGVVGMCWNIPGIFQEIVGNKNYTS